MNKQRISLYVIFRDITMLTTFIFAVYLENARGSRLLFMSVLFALFFIWIHFREKILNRFGKLIAVSFSVDIILLILLDDSSKFVVNYYFNLYYFYILISAGFIPRQKHRLIVSFFIISSAFIKYYRFIEVAVSSEKYYNITFVVSYILFTFMVYVTVAVFFNHSRVLSEEKAGLDKLNRELKEANDLLEEKNQKIKELTIFEERNRIAREIHDSVGHNLTGLIMNLDFCENIVQKDVAKAQIQIASSRDIAKECLTEIRRSVQALKPVVVEQLPLIKSLEELVNSSKHKFAIDIGLVIKGEIYKTGPDFNIVVYRAVQEAVTNAVRHGNATRVDVSINYKVNCFHMLIKDNGKGAEKFTAGSGLRGMKERIREFRGDVNFYAKDGFMINITIPVEA
ncbi:MAG: sensor histidine kinase [Clostridia bacterium]|nr:sensor histidine kinase [Clostridia bacterium]